MTPAEDLEERLSRPAPADVAAMRSLAGDLVVLGVSGKMGPSLARLAVRASSEAGGGRRVIGVARFSSPGAREALERHGVETIAADLLDRDAVRRLPDAPNVMYMAGQKFGTSGDQATTWAVNVHAAGIAAERYAGSRIVAFSTGNVYPLSDAPRHGRTEPRTHGRTDAPTHGPAESDATGPVGEYAQSALGRERILEFWSRRTSTPMAILRLNYAIEPRYGVLRDIAEKVRAGTPVDLAMGYVNVIWQREANAIALRCFAHASVPPFVLNLTGAETLAVRDIATQFGKAFGVEPVFQGREGDTALLSNAARCRDLFGPLQVTLGDMVREVADWMRAGGESLGKPTHFEEREGKF